MAESGQRISYTTIIDRPELKSPARNLIEKFITVVLWLVWGACMAAPGVALLDAIGVDTFVSIISSDHATSWQPGMLVKGAGLFFFILSVVFLWIMYNLVKSALRKGERRKTTRARNDNELARHFQVDTEHLKRVMRTHHCVQVVLRDSRLVLPLAYPRQAKPLAMPYHLKGLRRGVKHIYLYDERIFFRPSARIVPRRVGGIAVGKGTLNRSSSVR